MNRKRLNILLLTAVLSLLVLNISGTSMALELNPADSATITQTYTPHAIINIDGNAEFLAQDAIEDWPGDGSPESPIVISGYSFAAAEWMFRVENSDLHYEFIDNQLDGLAYVWCGIAIVNAANGVIRDNTVRRAAAGIHVVTVEDYIIEGNDVQDSPFGGIIVEDGSVNVTVKNNIVYDNENFGIHIGNPFGSATSHNITIVGNTVYGNSPGGITLLEAENCIVENNDIYDHAQKGIVLETASHHINFNNITDCQTGIHITGGNATFEHNTISRVEFGITVITENNTFTDNYIFDCEEIGLRFYYSYSDGVGGANNIVARNVFANNSRWGLDLTANADNNLIQNNYFFMNGDTCQATDDGANNVFDSNYWDDWIAPDANNDSIVDIPYEIDGDAENSDLHPMAAPNESIPPWYVAPSTSGNETTTTTGTSLPIEPLFLAIGGSAVVIVLIGVIFVKKRK
ncbi:hypothetical protein EU528_01175 [Candidatus Thorarchaeota archaeon]|nr:MAG: hypothetical protein EU528_01175 [Candidatus Thorarchaeota archaeon]